MFTFVNNANILESQSDALVNPVNCVGVMGKGLALQFKKRFPHVYEIYRNACSKGSMNPGRCLFVRTHQKCPRYVVNFPTKRHWRQASRLEDIEHGLADLKRMLKFYRNVEPETLTIRSIAVPPLGCGLGGLSWSDVRPLLLSHLEGIKGVNVFVYEPKK